MPAARRSSAPRKKSTTTRIRRLSRALWAPATSSGCGSARRMGGSRSLPARQTRRSSSMPRSWPMAAAAALALGQPAVAQQPATLNLVTAGDQNMLDYVKDYLAPMFEKSHPLVTVKAVSTGPGDAGSQKIYEKIDAQKGNPNWDVDVAVIHQKAAGEMVPKGLLAKY